MALPNFVAEYKGKGDMKIAHQQARLDGGFASQGLYRLYNQTGHLKTCLGQALVGSLEYNGEIIIGNVHWATESASNPGGVDYHMRRVMSHFTRGLSFEDFVKNRAEARSFRRFFADKRKKVLKELLALQQPAARPRSYGEMHGVELREKCQEAKIPCSRLTVEQMRQRLRRKRAERRIPRGSIATSQAASRMTPTPSMRSQDITSPMDISPTFSKRQGREDEGGASNKRRRSH